MFWAELAKLPGLGTGTTAFLWKPDVKTTICALCWRNRLLFTFMFVHI